MDATTVKMQSPTKKRAGGDDHSPGRRAKRQAITPTRLTRSMLKKLNKNGGPPVELNPGLEMGVRRRGPRTRPPKRAAQDEGLTGSVKRTTTTHRRRAQSRAKKPIFQGIQPAESKSAELQPKEIRSARSESADLQPIEPQPAEPHPTIPQPGDQERRVSEADVAAASRLAQAAVAAGLTGTTLETGTPLAENTPSLVRFTKRDLKELLIEAVDDYKVRQKLEPHWLARTEFLTWWERPAADMEHIRQQVRRLAVRWSKDLQAQDPDVVDIPVSMLESWQADIVIVGDPKVDTGESSDEAESKNRKGEIDENEAVKQKAQQEEEHDEAEEKEEQGAEVLGNEKEGEKEGVDDSHKVAKALAESLALAMREMAEWKEAFDKEIAAEPDFRSKRAWTARVSESQKQAAALEEAIRDLDTHKFERNTSSARKAAEGFLGELQQFRVGIRMDREAFWDEFDQEGAELLSWRSGAVRAARSESRENAEEEFSISSSTSSSASSSGDFGTDLEAELEAELEQQAKFLDEVEESDSKVEEEDTQMVELQADKEGTRITEREDHHDLSAGDGSVSESGPGPIGPLHEVRCYDSDSKSTPARQEIKLEDSTRESLPSSQRDESTSAVIAPITHVESNCKVLEDRSGDAVETYAAESTVGPPRVEKEERFEALPVTELEQQNQEGKETEAGETRNNRETPHSVPDERGSQSPSRQWPGQQQEESEVTNSDTIRAAEEQENPSHEVRTDVATELFNSATIEEIGIEVEHTTNQRLTASDISRLPPDTISAASSTRSASHEVITGAAENTVDSSSTASNISSLPENPSSSTSGRSETAEQIEVENLEHSAPDVPGVTNVPQDISLPQDTNSSIAGVPTEDKEEVGGGMEERVDKISPISHITSMMEEARKPRSIGASIISVPPRSVEEAGSEPEETVDRTPATRPPQDTGLTASGISSGGEIGVGGQVGHTVDDDLPPSDAAALRRGSNVGEVLDVLTTTMSPGKSPIIVPTVRYIKPQWESLFSPEEPTYDYSANEAEDDDNDDDQVDYPDDWEADDVDP